MAWNDLIELAIRQHHSIHVRQLGSAGVARSTFYDHVKAESWEQPYINHGVFTRPGAPDTLERRISAALLVVGERVTAARRTAAALNGFHDRPLPFLEIMVPHGCWTPSLPGVRVSRSRTLLKSHVETVDEITRTIGERTIIDCAAVMELERLRDTAIMGVQRRCFTIQGARSLRSSLATVPGGARLDEVFTDLAVETCDSRLEWHSRRLARSHGLRPYPGPFPYRCRDGAILHLDLALPRWWVSAECDGRAFHSDARSFARDRVRWSKAQVEGWRMVWITWHRLAHDPLSIIEELRALIANADPMRPPAQPAR